MRGIGKLAVAIVASAIPLLGLVGVTVPSSAAAAPKPSIKDLVVTPARITTVAGTATLKAKVVDGSSCALASKPVIGGMVASPKCSGGSVKVTIAPPENRSKVVISYALTLKAKGPGGSTSAKVMLEVAPHAGGVPPIFTSGSSTVFTATLPNSFRIWVAGFPAPTLSESGTLPAGVTFDAATGFLSGNPAVTGVFPIEIGASNNSGHAVLHFTLTVDGLAPSFTSASSAVFIETLANSFYVSTSGAPTPTVSESGTLPAGVTFDAATRSLAGTPTVTGVFPIEFEAVNSSGSLVQDFTLTVNGIAPSFTSDSSISFNVTGSNSFTVSASGVPAPTLSESGALPSGVTFEAATGMLSGTPTVTGVFPIDFEASNSYGSVVQDFDLVVSQPLTGITRVVGGNSGSCALLSSGGVDCWGYNGEGELGVGSTGGPDGEVGYDTPQAVVGVTNAVAIASGPGYCTVLSSGGVDCWGPNGDGELGNGTTGGPDGEDGGGGYDTPQAVAGITNAVAVTGGFVGYCALLSSGGVDCWGYNGDGEIGNGSVGGPNGSEDEDYDTPQAVSGLTDASEVVAGGFGYCAILTTGGVDCWGDNAHGELGNGSVGGPDGEGGDDYDTPQEVTGISDAVAVTSDGADGYCAVLASGGVDCWGDNSVGELGNGGTGGPDGADGYDTPLSVVGVTDASSISSNAGSFCAVLSSGGIDCWGSGSSGELGNGNVFTQGSNGDATPQAVVGITNAVAVTGGAAGYCAILSSGVVDCWGDDYYGQVGNGTFGPPDGNGFYDEDTPQAAIGITDAVGLSPDGNGYCALLSSGWADCWGWNVQGEVGNGTVYGSNSSDSPGAQYGVDTPQTVVTQRG